MVPSVKYSINSIVSGGGEHAVMAPGSSTRSSGPDLAAPCGALGGGRAAELGRATYSWAKAGPSFPPPRISLRVDGPITHKALGQSPFH